MSLIQLPLISSQGCARRGRTAGGGRTRVTGSSTGTRGCGRSCCSAATPRGPSAGRPRATRSTARSTTTRRTPPTARPGSAPSTRSGGGGGQDGGWELGGFRANRLHRRFLRGDAQAKRLGEENVPLSRPRNARTDGYRMPPSHISLTSRP